VTTPSIPAAIAKYIQEAAQGTGLPESVVAAQNYAESGYGTNLGPSSAGALGPWQFEPTTWNQLGLPPGEENSWPVSTQGYITYMKQLLQEEDGNVRNALAAYNAGPNNISAGYGYADSILAAAGQSQSVSVSGSGTDTSGASLGGGVLGSLSGVVSSLSSIADVFKDIDTVVMDVLNPAFWLRIVSFFAGVLLLIAGIWCLVHASDNSPIVPQNIPVVIPA
jgi:hypothetical protein